MEKEFVTYELALRMKQLGFDEPCLMQYNKSGLVENIYGSFKNSYFNHDDQVTAPLYQQAFRWFREKYGLGHMINGIGFETFIMNIGGIIEVFPMFKTYEEAELACLKKLIEIVKNTDKK